MPEVDRDAVWAKSLELFPDNERAALDYFSNEVRKSMKVEGFKCL